MTVTVSTSINPGGEPAAVDVTLAAAVQAARAFAAQGRAYLLQAELVLQQAQAAEAGAQLAYDQAQGLYQQVLQKVASQLGVDGLTAVVKMLPKDLPAQPGTLYTNGGYVVLST